MLVVTAAVIKRDDRLLIARRAGADAHAGRWELPGGKVESGESLGLCLARELAEELGIAAEVGEELGVSRHSSRGREIELHAMRVVAIRGVLRPAAHDEVRWALPSEWGGFDFLEADRPLLRMLGQRWQVLAQTQLS